MTEADLLTPVTWLTTEINAAVGGALVGVIRKLIDVITPLFLSAFGLYNLLLTINYMRGAEQKPLMDYFFKLLSWSLIIGIGFNYQTYTEVVMPIVTGPTGFGDVLANVFSGGSSSVHTFDLMFRNYVAMINTGFTSAVEDSKWYDMLTGALAMKIISVSLKAVILLVGVMTFEVIAVSFMLTANIAAQIVAVLGPIFFGFLLFPATRQYFSAWVNTLFSYALIPALIALVAVMASGVSNSILGITDAGVDQPITLADASLFRVILAAFANGVFIFMLKQVASIASSLSAGGINAGMGNAMGGLIGGAKGVMDKIKSHGDRKEQLAARKESQITRGIAQNARANNSNQIKGG